MSIDYDHAWFKMNDWLEQHPYANPALVKFGMVLARLELI